MYFASYKNMEGLRVFTNDGQGTSRHLDPQDFSWKGIKTPLFSVFDCLGYVLSLMGAAPAGATREDYFLPLLSFFSRNLINLGGNWKQTPRRAFIAYNDLPILENRGVLLSCDSELPRPDPSAPFSELDIALGATIAGPKDLKPRIQEARWAWMKEEGKLDLGPASDQSIKRPAGEERGQLFGHCAETIPLVIKLK